MYYEKGYTQISRFGNKNLRTSVRALIVFFVAMALLTSLPLTSMEANGARIVTTFDDGSESKIVSWTTVPLPGEVQTLYIKVRADVIVESATMNASGLAFGRSETIAGTGWTGYREELGGDIDNDGFNDFVISAPTQGGTIPGAIYVVRGSENGTITPANVTIDGATAGDRLGWGLASGGDINKDGYDDIVGGAIEIDTAGTATGSGSAYVYYGGSSPINTTPQVTLSNGATGDTFGWQVSNHGDLNGDGYDDVVVGAPDALDLNGPGKVYVYLSGAGGLSTTPDVTITGKTDGDMMGSSVHICGDINNDGKDDLLVGAMGYNGTNAADWDLGKLYLYFGNANGVNTTADWSFEGKNPGDNLGQNARGADDINGDGYDDLIGGAPLHDTTTTDIGGVYVFYGSSSGPGANQDALLTGTVGGGFFGWDLAGIGDANADGYADIAVGDPVTPNGATAGAGTVHIYMGNSNGIETSPVVSFQGTTANQFMGAALGPGGDVDGDGYDDVASGTRYAQQVYVHFGEGGPLNPTILLDDTSIWTHSGHLVGVQEVMNFASELNTYIQNHQNEVDGEGNILVPINVSFVNKGRLRVDTIKIVFYRLVQPTNLAATAMPDGSAIRLTWDDHTSKGDDISKMSIEMWNGTGWEEIIKVAKNAKEYIVTGLEDGQSYSFRILAFDGGVQRYSEPSDVAIGIPGDTQPPAKVTGIIAIEDRDLMGINVSWDPSDEDVVNYEVWSNKTGTWAILANISAPMVNYVDTEVEDGPRYYYKVRAWDEVPLVGEFSKIVWGVLDDLTPPAIPENLQIHIVSVGRALKLTWDINDDDTVAYSIESNKTGQWLEMSLVGSSVDTLMDTGLTDGTMYYYRLRAKDESNNFSNFTAVASGVPVDSEPPMAPMGLEATPRSVGNILKLTWILNDDDTVGYHIYIFGTSDWEFVTNVAEDVNQYEVGDLENGVTYRIRIKAVDLAERESDWSNEATGIPADTHPPDIPQGLKADLDPNGGAVNLSWDPNNDDTVSYNILEWSGSAWIEVGTVTHPQTWYYIDGLVNNQPYAYVVRSVDEADNESPNSQRVDVIPKDTVKPEPPVFVDLPVVTNQKDQVLTGHSDPFATIIAYLNMYPQEPVVCDDEGNFHVTMKLKNGPNEVYAEAVDDAGTSDPSVRHTILVDLIGPKVESTNPDDGTKDLGRLNFTWEVYFDEEVKMDSIKAYLTKGRTAHSDLVANIGDPSNIIPVLKDYNNVRSMATFEVMEELQSGSTYSILIYEVEDIAGNPLDHPNNAFSFFIETSTSGGGGDNGGGGDDDGLGSIALYAGAGIAILIVIIIAVFLVSRSGTREEIEVDRSIMAAPTKAPTPEQMRPDIGALYAEAYEERGEGDTEHHEVEGGLGDWLSEQDKSSKEADIEAKRLMEEMAQGAPPPEDTGPIEVVPPGLVEERAVPTYHTDSAETDAGAEAEPETGKAEAEEDVEAESEEAESESEDDAAALLDELDEELSKDEGKED